jgi:Coenzyme PQQ synthesis protein D (PqqD)
MSEPLVPKRAALTDVVCVSTSQVASRVGDEVAILDLDHSVYYGLDPVGARVWELIQEPTPLSAVLAAMLAEFEVDDATARVDLLALIDELLEKRLVELRSGNAT